MQTHVQNVCISIIIAKVIEAYCRLAVLYQ